MSGQRRKVRLKIVPRDAQEVEEYIRVVRNAFEIEEIEISRDQKEESKSPQNEILGIELDSDITEALEKNDEKKKSSKIRKRIYPRKALLSAITWLRTKGVEISTSTAIIEGIKKIFENKDKLPPIV